MNIIASHQPVLWWREILPLTLLASLIFFAMLPWNPLIGAVIIVPVVILGYLFDASRLWWLVIGLVPLSFNTELVAQSPVGMYLPTETLLLGFLVLSLLYFLRHPVDMRYLDHPLICLVVLDYSWVLISVVASTNSIVSFKSLVSQKCSVILVVYVGSTMIKSPPHRKLFLNIYLTGFTLVVIYTLIRLWSHGFPEKESQWLMQPFFKDHTILGAVLGLTMPYVYLRSFARSVRWDKRIWWIGLNVIFTIVLIFTYSRAAILSLVVSAALYFLIRL